MKKFTAVSLVLILCLSIFAGCGKKYAVEEGTVFVLKNGKIISTDVEDFDDSYDQAAFGEYVNAAIKDYIDDYGEDSLKLKGITIDNGKAILILEYASAKDYTQFNGTDIFAGTLVDALSAGYTLDADFASIADNIATACTTQDIIDSTDLKVVIFKGNGNVNVNGKILFASVANTKLVDGSTIAISPEYNLLGLKPEMETPETETVVPESSEADTESDTQMLEDAVDDDDFASVDEDDLLAGSAMTEPTEVEFNFDDADDFEDEEMDLEYTDVYTFIIYK